MKWHRFISYPSPLHVCFNSFKLALLDVHNKDRRTPRNISVCVCR